MIRESSPPDAASRSGDGGIPGLVATRSSTVSAPFGPKPSGWGSSETSSEAPSIASSASSLRDPALELARRPSRPFCAQLRGEPGAQLLGAAPAAARAPPARSLGVLEPLDLGAAALGVREHRLDRAAVLSLQAVERREPLLDLLQPPGLGLDAVEVGPQGAGRRRRARRSTARTRSASASSAGSTPLAPQAAGLGLASSARAPASRPRSPAIAARRPSGRHAQPSACRRRSRSAAKLALLVGVGRGRLDLGELVAEQVEVALPGSLALAQLGELARQRRRPRACASR